MAETLADLGEWELIRRLGDFAPPGQFADDAALVNKAGFGRLVLNTDLLVEGVHFSEATTKPTDVGWRAAVANLSDLAAMGCTRGEGITVGLVAPGATPWAWVEGVYGGLKEALETFGGVLLGGDCSRGGQRILAVTAIGQLSTPPDADCGAWGAIRRGDGRPGDALLCTGPHGLSRLGLALLQGELQLANGLNGALSVRAITAHQRPRARFDAVRALIGSRPPALRWRVGGCDSSDGLAAAVQAIAGRSGCAARLDREVLPLDPAMAALPQAEAWCLGGGEDFELVLALEPDWARALLEALPGASMIGELAAGPAGSLGWRDGRPWPESDGLIAGFRHFS
ncbi:MAG: thiamine-phosphate kinase [Cyanobacteriota bacterium]|nr:thiamine-phosphate kinase [Cyanobacteriota bacterium]